MKTEPLMPATVLNKEINETVRKIVGDCLKSASKGLQWEISQKIKIASKKASLDLSAKIRELKVRKLEMDDQELEKLRSNLSQFAHDLVDDRHLEKKSLKRLHEIIDELAFLPPKTGPTFSFPKFGVSMTQKENKKWVAEVECVPGAIFEADTPFEAYKSVSVMALKIMTDQIQSQSDESILPLWFDRYFDDDSRFPTPGEWR